MDTASMQVCRLCMEKTQLSCIFKSDDGIRLDVKAMACAVIHVKKHDGLPSYICSKCKIKLNEFYDFKLKCETTEIKLRNLLKSEILCTVKSESTDSLDVKEEFDLIKSEINNSERDYSDDNHDSSVICDENLFEITKKEKKESCGITTVNNDSENNSSVNMLTVEQSINFGNKFKRKKKRKVSIAQSDKAENAYVFLERLTMMNNDTKKNKDMTKSLKLFQCELCGCTYKTKSILKKHLLTHTSEKPFSCPLCPKRYTRSEHLVVHMRSHTGVKPYVCETCARPFSKNQDLSRHRRIHSDEKRYQCPRCDRKFKRSADIHTHMRTHTGVRPYVCKNCSKSYTSHSGLWKHYRNHCTLCIPDVKQPADDCL